ncbi:MAG: hypothetical protein ABUS79_30215, partial [Pseudomonadota bacterium]
MMRDESTEPLSYSPAMTGHSPPPLLQRELSPSAGETLSLPAVPPVPTGSGAEVLAWAKAHGVEGRLDDACLPSHDRAFAYFPQELSDERTTTLTYRRLLVERNHEARRWARYFDVNDEVRVVLHRMAVVLAEQQATRRWMDAHARDPSDENAAALLVRLREFQRERPRTSGAPGVGVVRPRPLGTYVPVGVDVIAAPQPLLRYGERTLHDSVPIGRSPSPTVQVSLALLGWNESDDDLQRRWSTSVSSSIIGRAPEPEVLRAAALDAMIDFLRDARRADAHAELAELLAVPSWRYALGDLDRRLTLLQAQAMEDARSAAAGAAHTSAGAGASGRTPRKPEARVGFRVVAGDDGSLTVEPVVQKRARSGAFSRGSRIEWRQLTDRKSLTEADRRVYMAHADPFLREFFSPARTFAVLRALIDHPAVVLEDRGTAGRRGADVRPDIRQGRLRLRFASGPDGGLAPRFDLLGHTFLPAEIGSALRGSGHVIHLYRPEGQAPQVLLAAVSEQAAAVVQALAAAPGRFPPDAHDALATRLESLQEAMDIEFPSQWTRTIADADARPVVRLEMLASGALRVRLSVRPVALGPLFPPGEGPTLVLEGQGQDRHGARRDP